MHTSQLRADPCGRPKLPQGHQKLSSRPQHPRGHQKPSLRPMPSTPIWLSRPTACSEGSARGAISAIAQIRQTRENNTIIVHSRVVGSSAL
eukprot:12920880-Prorocentrum_lima.AAC.1